MTALQKVTSSEPLTKQAMRKKIVIHKKIHTYLSYFSPPELRPLSYWEKLPVSKKTATCELNHVLTPSINSSLLLKHCVLNHSTSASGKYTGGSHTVRDQGCKEDGQTTPS
jgi:hypothetical protein